jgi:hypothetical protein
MDTRPVPPSMPPLAPSPAIADSGFAGVSVRGCVEGETRDNKGSKTQTLPQGGTEPHRSEQLLEHGPALVHVRALPAVRGI